MSQTLDPTLYTNAELQELEAHIVERFGMFEIVLHEIASPDLHVDICVIPPSSERNFYTLVTMGMGAHRMKVPEELRDAGIDRAELMICLPPDWKIPDRDEKWYWPVRWLKVLARLPVSEDCWLGWGHTVPNGEPFAENTELCGVLLAYPLSFGEQAVTCALPSGESVRFYQVLPLYAEELAYKAESGADSFIGLLDHEFTGVVDIARKNYCLNIERHESRPYLIPIEALVPILTWDGAVGCLATDRIMRDGCKVGYMYRETPDEGVPDSGWRFLAGDESPEYLENSSHAGVYHLNTLCNYDRDIMPLLESPIGSAFERGEDGIFAPAKD